MADLVERITRAISTREEPRMWEYYRVGRVMGAFGLLGMIACLAVIIWGILR